MNQEPNNPNSRRRGMTGRDSGLPPEYEQAYSEQYAPGNNPAALDGTRSYEPYPDPEPVSKMPWLKHIWWCSAKATIGLPCSTAEELFTETLPDTILFFDGAHPVDGGWREFQTYYDMRDLMEMFYLR